jgi:hypothetical protein
MAIGALLTAAPVTGEEGPGNDPPWVDCRYEGIGTSSPRPSPLDPFPEHDVFRPLLADPKQPQFFATWQATRVRGNDTSVNLGSVALGDNFGLIGRRRGCDGWQVGILGGVFAQFNLDASSTDLINADYVVGIPFSWRRGLFSTRLRIYHQSSHLGDEFLLGNPGINRVNLSFEAVEAILSLDTPGGWGRVYVGGSTLIHRVPATLDRNGAQWGLELRGPTMQAAFLSSTFPALRVTPVAGADFKCFEELDWDLNTSVVAGFEWSKTGAGRRVRTLVNYYRGFAPYGQFYGQKIEMIGIGLYLSF